MSERAAIKKENTHQIEEAIEIYALNN